MLNFTLTQPPLTARPSKAKGGNLLKPNYTSAELENLSGDDADFSSFYCPVFLFSSYPPDPLLRGIIYT